MDDIEDIVTKEQQPIQRQLTTNVVTRKKFRNKEKEKPESTTNIPGTQSVYVKTWGCSHNTSDGEYMAGLLSEYGYEISSDSSAADVWVLNSCTVKSPSEAHLVTWINKAAEQKKKVVICGCVPQAQPNHKEFEGLSLVGVQQIDRITEVVEETLKGHNVRLLKPKKEGKRKLGGAELDLPKIRKNPLIEIVPISTGCLNRCTYCKTKYARGDLGSYPPQEIVRRIKKVISEGVREIWLSSEDTGAYGLDINTNIAELLNQIVSVLPEHVMLRIGMTNPPYILDHLEAIATILNHPRVYSFLHIPVQAASDKVLSDMKRKYTIADFKLVVDTLREKVPGVTIATDIICGFPTETAEDFDLTLDLCRQYKFPVLHISQFYPRPGTPAASMKRVLTQEVKRRSRELTKVFESYETYSHKLGSRETVLVTEDAHDGIHLIGHNKSYEQILIAKDDSFMGKTLDVKIVGSGKHFLIGEAIEETVQPLGVVSTYKASTSQTKPQPQPQTPTLTQTKSSRASIFYVMMVFGIGLGILFFVFGIGGNFVTSFL